MNPLRLLRDLVASLHGGADPRHLAAGFALGAALGLTPKAGLMPIVFLLVFFALRINKGMALVTAALFTPVSYALDGLFHDLGWALLKAGALQGLWAALYDLPLVPLTRFNNTVVLGSLVVGLALYAPLYFLGLRLVDLYARTIGPKVESLALVKAVKGAYWYRTYQEWTS